MLPEILQNVICSLKGNGHIVVFLLDLLIADGSRTVIRNSCCLDDNILFLAYRCDSLIHIPCCHHRNHLHKGRRRNGSTSTYQCDICTSQHCHFRNGVAHLAGRMVGNIADRINGLLGRTSCDKQLQPFHILLAGALSHNIGQKSLRLRHFAGSCVAAGKIAHCRIDHFISVMLQGL